MELAKEWINIVRFMVRATDSVRIRIRMILGLGL